MNQRKFFISLWVSSMAILMANLLATAASSPTVETTSPPVSSDLQAQSSSEAGKFCNVQAPNGGWWLWITGDMASDPCRVLLTQHCTGPECRVVSSGTYLLNGQNEASVNCQGYRNRFVGLGVQPLGQAFDSVVPFRPFCSFQVRSFPGSNSFPIGQGRQNRNNRRRRPDFNPNQNVNPSSTSPASGMAAEMIDAHNRWRQQVGVPPLNWSSELANYAQDWANQLATSGNINHRPNSRFGENIFWISGRQASPTEVVNTWGSEVRDYDYSSNGCRNVCGHYTQVVWKNTQQVGCGAARSGNQEFWVCNYNPPGNFVGQRPY